MAGNKRKGIAVLLVFCVAAMLSFPLMAAQEPVFRLDMDSLNLQKGVSGSLTVSLINAQGAEIAEIEGIEEFDILSESISTSISISGSGSAYQEDRHYTIMPKTAGQFNLKASIRFNGREYESNVLPVTVAESSAAEGEAESDLFVKTVLSQEAAYLGEKIIVTYELYSRYNLENFGFADYTAVDGVMSKDLPAEQGKADYVYLEGVRYARYVAKQLVLDPIRAGNHTIPSFTLQVNVIIDEGPGRLFGGGMGGMGSFFSRTQAVYLQTEERELTIKALPAQGKPVDFSGIVGELHLDGQYSRDELNYGDSLSLRAKAYGNCNLDGLKELAGDGLPGFAVYETQQNITESVVNGQYHAEKEFELILVPERNGVLPIAPVSLSYFNPQSANYERAEIPGASITVLGEMPLPAGGGSGFSAAMETVAIHQVYYRDTDEGYFTIQMRKQVVYGVAAGIALLLILAAALIWLLLSRKRKNTALQLLYRQLMAAKDAQEIYSLFNAMVRHCYHLSLKASSQKAVWDGLPDRMLASQVIEIMNLMESEGPKDELALKEKIKSIFPLLTPLRELKS
ncbi:MAG: BatD family protein [Clostridiales bacterium]|nr:BatD family protein [Clostridiales bacterium]